MRIAKMNQQSNIGLKQKIAQGEGQYLEFKEKPKNIEREMVAFANATGGTILIGVNDNCKIIGISLTNKLKSSIQDKARNCDPPIMVDIKYHLENVVEIQVEAGNNKPYRCREGFFLRVGPNCQKLNRNEIIQLILSEGNFHFDETINTDFVYEKDFDKQKFERFLKIAEIESFTSYENLLLSLYIAKQIDETIKLSQAGVLFFAKTPQLFLKESHITCVRYEGTDRFNIIDREDISDDIVTMIEKTLIFIKRNIKKSYVITDTPQRQEIFEYPLVAVREAVINAFMHRDYYYDASRIYVHIFSNRMEIENPGGLYSGLKLEDLGKRSIRRNRMIADLLYRIKYVEQIGSGIIRMEKALALNNNPKMEISATNFFSIKFFPRIYVDKKIQLTSRQNLLYQLFKEKENITKSESALLLNVSSDTALREIKVLIHKGLVIKKGIGKSTFYCLK
jgi:ATP-dependent DNA helicase RecG